MPADEADPEPVVEPARSEVQSGDFPATDEETVRLVATRLHAHDGFDRFVLEFDGPPPSWHVRPTEGPITEQPGGAVVELDGDELLEVRLVPATSVDLDAADPTVGYDGPSHVDGRGGPVAEAAMTRDHERTLVWALGLRGQPAFAVAVLEGPDRLVVDVVGE